MPLVRVSDTAASIEELKERGKDELSKQSSVQAWPTWEVVAAEPPPAGEQFVTEDGSDRNEW